MRFRSSCLLLLAIFLPFNSKGESTEELSQKIYISSTDLQITDHGIFLYNVDEGYLPVDAVFSDNCGLYIIELRKPSEADNKCPNKHQIYCWKCLGCAVSICKFRCKCVEWPFQVSE